MCVRNVISIRKLPLYMRFLWEGRQDKMEVSSLYVYDKTGLLVRMSKKGRRKGRNKNGWMNDQRTGGGKKVD